MSHELLESKRMLRADMRRRRRMLGRPERDHEAAATAATLRRIIAALSEGDVPRPVASYMATPEELDLHLVHQAEWDAGRPVWLPRIQGPRRLEWYAVHHPDQVRIGTLNLCEPDPEAVTPSTLPPGVVLLVPGVAYGSDGRRLGMGGGFYDRVLLNLVGVSIGVGFSCQRADDLPVEPHDLPCAAVVLGGEILCRPEALRSQFDPP